jgi:hypothetical protein
MAFCLVRRDRTGMPLRRERHGLGDLSVDMVVVVIEPLCGALHATRLDALRALSHGSGAGLGKVYLHSALDGPRPGVSVACPRAHCGVWRLGPRGRGTPSASAARARAVGALALYHPVAIDDTNGHRTGKQVWGPSRFTRQVFAPDFRFKMLSLIYTDAQP